MRERAGNVNRQMSACPAIGLAMKLAQSGLERERRSESVLVGTGLAKASTRGEEKFSYKIRLEQLGCQTVTYKQLLK